MKFSKMHGLGNDYIFINCTKGYEKVENPEELTKKLVEPHFGIGADGMILICDSIKADFRMRIFNRDGSEGEICGNGIRGVGKYVYDFGLTRKEEITIETLAGIKNLKLNINKGKVSSVKVDMGESIFDHNKIPIICDNDKNIIKLNLFGKIFNFHCLSTGNPHAITLIDDVEKCDVDKYGKIVQSDEHFPKKINVEFVQIIDKKTIKMRAYERGSGETLACGTGACAAVVSCSINGLTERNVRVKLLRGFLDIEYNENNNHIYMTGPTVLVFKGEIDLDDLDQFE